jgi:hypothetical protein
MIDYVLFEKKPEEDRPAWTLDLVKEFCEDQKYDVASFEDSPVFIVAKMTTASEDTDKKYRHLELTATVSFILRDDPSLDEFLEPEIPKHHPMTFCREEKATIEEIGDSKEEEPFHYA